MNRTPPNPLPTLLAVLLWGHAGPAPADDAPTHAGVLQTAPDDAWRRVDQSRLLYIDLPQGRVLAELAPAFAPQHVQNLRLLAAERYFDGLAVTRVQDNYVVQWGDPDAGDEVDPAASGSDSAHKPRTFGTAKTTLPAEFHRTSEGLNSFAPVPDGDIYAPEAGFIDGFPVGRDPTAGRSWLAHCYGMLGVGRDNDPDSGNASQLYVVTGHAPRHLDRNVTLIGRVLLGMEHLSSLPRGDGPMGFFNERSAMIPLTSIRLGDALPADRQIAIEVMRTDSDSFAQVIEARRNRHEEWFAHPTGRVELCNVPLPVRMAE